MPSVRAIVKRVLRRDRFEGSADYWQKRYLAGGNSGAGSYDRLATFKAEVLNDFVQREAVQTVLEFGSGDGAQLTLARYPSYTGVDVAWRAIEESRARFAADRTKRFLHSSEVPADLKAELTLSLDVIYHLVEDPVFHGYMAALFDASTRWVIIYASNEDAASPVPHVRHRRFTDWIERERPDFALKERIANAFPFDPADPDHTSFADFYIFERA